jgi:predicted metal-dependent phosphoesterase TrpH
VERVRGAGIQTLAVTDHDTIAAIADTRRLAGEAGLRFIDGIEISAVWQERDVHVLGYFVPPDHPALTEFLRAQRTDRVRRVHEMAARLADLGAPIDIGPILRRAQEATGRAVGRPDVARALLDAGHVISIADAFDRHLSRGCPAYVARCGATPADVVRLLAEIGAASSLAHPGLSRVDEIIPGLSAAGLTALEAYHGDHDEAAVSRYVRMAGELGLGLTGGSDYHGECSHRVASLGRAGPPADAFEAFCRRAGRNAQTCDA